MTNDQTNCNSCRSAFRNIDLSPGLSAMTLLNVIGAMTTDKDSLAYSMAYLVSGICSYSVVKSAQDSLRHAP